MNHEVKKKLQENLYDYPYHYIPYVKDGIRHLSRSMAWGFKYLANLETVLDQIKELKPKRYLDFGCGDARLIYEVCSNELVGDVVGVDASVQALSYARAMNFQYIENGNLNFYKDLKSVDGQFDFISCIEVLEHISDDATPQVLELLRSKLAPDGVLFISVPSKNMKLIERHYRHYDLALFSSYVGVYFEIVEVSYLHKMSFFARVVRSLTHNRFFTLQIRPLLRLNTWLYKQFIQAASADNGEHLHAKLRHKT